MTTIHQAGIGAILLCLVLLNGCASSQARNVDGGLSDTIGPENLDLLFSTEFPVASREEAIARSKVAFREGDLDKALFYSVKALKFAPHDTEVLMRIGHLHVLTSNDRLAARAFNLTLAQEPGHAEALQGLGLLYFKAGSPAKARQHLESAVAADDRLWQSWNVLGILADERKEFSLAAGYYEKALQVNPESTSVRINLGYSRYLAGELSQAARDFYDVATTSDHPKAWRNLGIVYAARGWYEVALEVFGKVENKAVAYNRVGLLALDNRDFDVAYDCFTEAIRHSPVYFADAEQNLAKAEQQRGIAANNR